MGDGVQHDPCEHLGPRRGSRTTYLLIASRFARSIGQGALVVDFSLYLRALGWSAVRISFVLSAAMLLAGGLALVFGPLSDRFGRRRFLLAYEATQMPAALLALLSAHPWAIATAAVIGGFGRGANGAAGPFSPVEQAWLAQSLPASRRGPVYSLNAASGFIGMAIGAVAAILPAHLHALLPGARAYRPLFLLPLLGSALCLGLLLMTQDTEARPARSRQAGPPGRGQLSARREENRLLFWLVIANALNGTGIGLTGPLIAYWFAVRFGEGPEQIGPMMAGSFVMAAVSSVLVGQLSRLLGIVRAVVVTRIAGLALLLALPFAPSFGLATLLYIGRAMFNRGTAGARQALNISLVRPERRGLAASLANVSMQLPRAGSPIASGFLFDEGQLTLPFLIAVGFQAGYLVVYQLAFGNSEAGAARDG